MRILVTAGPTREFIDKVRFISNPSSGKMGFEVARAARMSGHRVTLISGPTNLRPPAGIEYKEVISALQMYRECMRVYPRVEAIVMTAAVADYRPIKKVIGKIKRGTQKIGLTLVPNPDIIGAMGRRKGKHILVGFALEVDRPEYHALKKLRRKNLDFIVINSPGSFGADRVSATILSNKGLEGNFRGITKLSLAKRIIRLIEQRLAKIGR
jgi:phosphopantothenoylcysteine decarboxylase/phosphopantothenate--cysteine ligase